MNYKAVLFDFDYTLGDSTEPICIGYARAMAAMGHPEPTREQVRPTIGYTLQDGYTMITGDQDQDRRQQFFHQFQEAVGELALQREDPTMVVKTKFFPGARELLEGLKAQGLPVAMVSTKLGSTIRAIFEHNGMEHLVDFIVGGEHVTKHKPDPEGLLFALDHLGLSAGEILFCGDTTIDARTAQAAGADFCAVLNGTTPAEAFEEFPHVHIAPDLANLKDWLEV